LGRRRRS